MAAPATRNGRVSLLLTLHVKKFLLPAIALLLILPPLLLLLLSSTPRLDLEPAPSVIGAATPVTVQATNPHGIRSLDAFIEQAGHRYPVYHVQVAAHRVLFFGGPATSQYHFTAGKKATPELTDGKATLQVQATSNDLRASTVSATREVTVVTRPPSITPDDKQHYINQGGTELITYSLGGYATDSGVRLDRYRFRSFPLPGTERRFSLFAFPWDVAVTAKPLVYATNSADEVTAGFWNRVFPKSFRKRDLAIDDAFLERVVNQIDPSGSGDLITRFLKINGELRKQNNQTLADLRAKTADKFLWSGPFLQLSNSKVESQFADVRSYVYKGKKVDQQVHLGFDLIEGEEHADRGRQRWPDRVGGEAGHLRQLRCDRPRLHAAIDLRPPQL